MYNEVAGEVAEWFKAHAWKACVGATLPRVRIPLSPPRNRTPQGSFCVAEIKATENPTFAKQKGFSVARETKESTPGIFFCEQAEEA